MSKWCCESNDCDETTPAIPLNELWPEVGWGCLRLNHDMFGSYISIRCGRCLAKLGATYNDETGKFEL